MHGYLIKINQRLDKSFFFITGGIKGRRRRVGGWL
jgi:hypothetical protein